MLSFFKTARFISNSVSHQSKKLPLSGNIILYFWEPYPNRVFGLNNKPLLGYFSGGDTGHISMKINYANGDKSYISIWPNEIEETDVQGRDERIVIKPISNTISLQNDIKTERGREPHEKIIEINEKIEERLRQSVEKLENELKKDPRERIRWSLTNNCATFIENILHESGIIHFKQHLISTPRYIFNIADKFEQEIYLKNYKSPSYKD